jgi:hypothetical protein
LFVWLFVCSFVCLLVCSFVGLFVCLFVCWFVRLFVWLCLLRPKFPQPSPTTLRGHGPADCAERLNTAPPRLRWRHSRVELGCRLGRCQLGRCPKAKTSQWPTDRPAYSAGVNGQERFLQGDSHSKRTRGRTGFCLPFGSSLSLPGRAQGAPKTPQGAPKEPPRAPMASPRTPGSAQGAPKSSQGAPQSSQGVPLASEIASLAARCGLYLPIKACSEALLADKGVLRSLP